MESDTDAPGASTSSEEFPLQPETRALLRSKWNRRWRFLGGVTIVAPIFAFLFMFIATGVQGLLLSLMFAVGAAALIGVRLYVVYVFWARKAMNATVGVRQSGPLRCWRSGAGGSTYWRLKAEGGPDLIFWDRYPPDAVEKVHSGTVEYVKEGRLILNVQEDAGTVLYQLT
jgi:hypothetical protein